MVHNFSIKSLCKNNNLTVLTPHPCGCSSSSADTSPHGISCITFYMHKTNRNIIFFHSTHCSYAPLLIHVYQKENILFYLVYSSFMFELLLFSVFACLGFLSPANRGALMTCSLVSNFVVLVCCIVRKMVFFYDLT